MVCEPSANGDGWQNEKPEGRFHFSPQASSSQVLFFGTCLLILTEKGSI